MRRPLDWDFFHYPVESNTHIVWVKPHVVPDTFLALFNVQSVDDNALLMSSVRRKSRHGSMVDTKATIEKIIIRPPHLQLRCLKTYDLAFVRTITSYGEGGEKWRRGTARRVMPLTAVSFQSDRRYMQTRSGMQQNDVVTQETMQ